MNKRLQRRAVAHIERAYALRRVQLVTGDREQVDARPVDRGFNLADGLRSIGVHEHALRVGDPLDLRDRLDGADLVVGVHDANQDGARRQRAADIIGIDQACPVDRKVGDPGAQALEEATWRQDRRMLDLACDDMIGAVAPGEEDALQGQIVGLAAAACNTTSPGRQPSSAATCPPAASTRARAGIPAQWPLKGLPKASSRSGRMASATRGSIGVLAL
jgi:hypothetical protein